jgi:hypothetical protein
MTLQSGQIQPITSILKTYSKLEIADFQRNYSWTVDDVTELFEDIRNATFTKDRHFMGCLILHETGSGDHERTCSVVDGQQRLTTIFLLISRIRDEIAKLETKVIPSEGDAFERHPDSEVNELLFNGAVNKPRFTSNLLLREMFLSNMVLPNHAEPPERDHRQKAITLPLRSAYFKLRDKIKEEIKDIPTDLAKLQHLTKYLDALKQLDFLAISTTDLNESLDVFLTLNNRGMPLGPSDIIRGLLVQSSCNDTDPTLITEIHKKFFDEWAQILKRFDEAGEDQSSLDQFFRYFLLATGPSKVQKKAAPKEIETRLKFKNRTTRTARTATEVRITSEAIWKQIIEMSNTWIDIVQPPTDFDDDMAYHLKILRSVADNYRVLLLNVFSPTSTATSEEQKEIVRLCYVLTFRYYLNGGGAQDLETKFQEIGQKFVSTDEDVKISATQLVDELKTECDISMNFENKFRDGVQGFAKPILHGIEKVLRTKAGANPLPWSGKDLHLEHIAPDTSTDHWLGVLTPGGNEEDQYDDLVDQLGNKTLLDQTINKRIKQSPFQIKSAKYVNSSPLVTRDLANLEGWTSSEIRNRNFWLAEMFEKIWTAETLDSSSINSYTDWKILPKSE